MIDQKLILDALKSKLALEIRKGLHLLGCQGTLPPAASPRSNQDKGPWQAPVPTAVTSALSACKERKWKRPQITLALNQKLQKSSSRDGAREPKGF